jgi:perosamine synthetase
MFGREYNALATTSGTTAIHTALLACGVKPGDEVISPAFSFFSTASMISAIGATPVFVDVMKDGLINANEIYNNITNKTKAVIAVNLYGKAIPDIRLIEEICSDYNVYLIIDACQSPARFGGAYGNISCFSFYATKNITTGEGGMVVTYKDELLNRCSKIINHGQEGKYNHVCIGYNYRMTNIAAAIGLAQMKRLDAINKRRREIAGMYNDGIEIPPSRKPEIIDDHVFHQYVIKSDKRDDLSLHLSNHGIETAIHYPKPIPRQPVYRKIYKDKKYPMSEQLSDTVLSIPCHPGLTDEDVATVIEAINGFFEKESP